MANNNNLPDEEPKLLVAEEIPKKPISILGVQALMGNEYSMPEHKILLTIIQHAQWVIKEYVAKKKIYHGGLMLDPSQNAAGYVAVNMALKEFGYSATNNNWLKSKLDHMGKEAIVVPFKVGDATYYKQFPCLFTPYYYKTPQGKWMVSLHFCIEVMQYFYAFDKGITRIDLNVINSFRNVVTRKMYLALSIWLNHGFSTISPRRIMVMMYGKEKYNYFSDLEGKMLLVAQQEMKDLYDKQLLDFYFTYTPAYKDDIKKAMPEHIAFTKHDRKFITTDQEEDEDTKYWKLQLKLKLIYIYNITESVAEQISSYMRVDLVAELHNWFLRKDRFIEKQTRLNKSFNQSGYIIAGLRGFFHDKGIAIAA